MLKCYETLWYDFGKDGNVIEVEVIFLGCFSLMILESGETTDSNIICKPYIKIQLKYFERAVQL